MKQERHITYSLKVVLKCIFQNINEKRRLWESNPRPRG